ncbi:MAG: hypothetical protein HRU20_30330 [Pseudomonadales bacterium]|nr:hypothetical protein [Pseudomonadales bacterium]
MNDIKALYQYFGGNYTTYQDFSSEKFSSRTENNWPLAKSIVQYISLSKHINNDVMDVTDTVAEPTAISTLLTGYWAQSQLDHSLVERKSVADEVEKSTPEPIPAVASTDITNIGDILDELAEEKEMSFHNIEGSRL